MAFMALLFWVFIPVILLALAMGTLQQIVEWVKVNAALVNVIVVSILVLNILIIFALSRIRFKQKDAGQLSWDYIWQRPGLRRLERIVWKLTLYLWPVCAGFWALLCAVFLVVQPVRFIPEHLFQIPTAKDFYGTWEITDVRWPGSWSQEELESYIGVRVVYEKERFTADGQTYPLDYGSYDPGTTWREEKIVLPGTVSVWTFDELGIETRNVQWFQAKLVKKQDEPVLGQRFYILDWDAILICFDGVFFQAERMGQLSEESP